MKTISILFLLVSLLPRVVSAQAIDLIEESDTTVMPDLLKVDYIISAVNKKENEAMAELTIRIKKKLEALHAAGFERESIRLAGFRIGEQYEYGEKRREKIGYLAAQTIKITVPAEKKEMISRLFQTLEVDKDANVQVSIYSEFSDLLKKQITADLIRMALKSARHKATAIAKDLRVGLGPVKNVEYGSLEFGGDRYHRVRYMAPPLNMSVSEDSPAAWNTYDITESELSETVHVVWTIQEEK